MDGSGEFEPAINLLVYGLEKFNEYTQESYKHADSENWVLCIWFCTLTLENGEN